MLSSDLALEPIPLETAIADSPAGEGRRLRVGGNGEMTEVVCGQFSFAGVLAPKLLTVLPALIIVEALQGIQQEWVRLISHFLIEETRSSEPGSAIMIERLLDLLFVQAIRAWGTKNPSNLGWLSGLKDPSIGRALSAIHAEPARNWTVETLAGLAGLSRSAFSARFSDAVGQPPLTYLAGWRLNLAADQLRSGTFTIGEIASAVGYGSEAALSRAFKTQFGVTPSAFRRSGGI
ncbi:Transcriptional regulator, AraC-family (fragment) [Bradyrhizobium sp. STM 3809]